MEMKFYVYAQGFGTGFITESEANDYATMLRGQGIVVDIIPASEYHFRGYGRVGCHTA